MSAVTNGFDEEDIPPYEHQPHPRFTLTYTGKIHKVYQDPEVLFSACAELLQAGKIARDRMEIRFAGSGYFHPDLQSLISKYHLEEMVTLLGKLDHDEALREQVQADVLFLMDWDDGSDLGHGVAPVKFYEYLGACRPILIINGKNDADIVRIVQQAGCGHVARNREELMSRILQFYHEFHHKGELTYSGDPEVVQSYSRRSTARKMAEIFEQVLRSEN